MPSIIVITLTDPGRVYGKMNPESIVQPKCKCKVGSCLLCGSSCKRWGCACDGIEPAVALARTTGQWGPLKRSLTNSAAERDHLEREAAKRAKIEISKSVELEGTNTDPTMKQPLQNINDLWEAFGWSEGTKKKLPNEKSRISDESLKEAGGSG